MIITSAPLRISLFGGGTDLLSYSTRFGGFLCGAAIDHKVHIVGSRPLFDPRVRVKIHDTVELVEELTNLKNPEVLAALALTGVQNHVELVHIGEITGGTGLGTSGAYLVGLMNLLYCFNGKRLAPKELAEAAAHIEIDILGYPIGKQDHYMSAFGGVMILNIAKDGSVREERLGVAKDVLAELRNHLLLLYTHRRHVSGKILGVQKKSAERGDTKVFECYHKIKEIAHLGVRALREGDIIRCGELFHQHWLAKRQLPGGVSNEFFDSLYREALCKGALGGKVSGAGGGGCILIFCKPAKRVIIKNTLCRYGLEEFPFNFDFRGAEIDCSRAKPHELAPFKKEVVGRLIMSQQGCIDERTGHPVVLDSDLV